MESSLIKLNPDKIYCVTLERRKHDRLPHAQKQFESVGLLDRVTFWNAFDGAASDFKPFHDGSRVVTAGMYGCFMSHKLIFEDALRNNLESFVVFEDDLTFVGGFNTLLEWMLPDLPEDWQFAYLGYTEYGGVGSYKKMVNENWVVPSAAWGTQGYMVRTREAMIKIHRYLNFTNRQIDELLSGTILPESGIRYYAAFPSLIGQAFKTLGTDVQVEL